jgi:hypothetical protein
MAFTLSSVTHNVTPHPRRTFSSSSQPVARNVLSEDLLGYEQHGDKLVPVLSSGFDMDAKARGWPIYPREQRGIALRVGTIVAWAHGWRIDGVHDLLFENAIPTSKEKPIKIGPCNRFTRILGHHDVMLEMETHEPP